MLHTPNVTAVEHLLAQPCAACHAVVGQPCRTHDGTPLPLFHTARHRTAAARGAPTQPAGDERLTYKHALDSNCPACHAPAGTPCLTTNGKPLRRAHLLRQQVAARQRRGTEP